MGYLTRIKIAFDEPSLGNIRNPAGPDLMPRDVRGRVVFDSKHWRAVMTRAADAYSRHQRLSANISFSSAVEGEVGIYRRFYWLAESGRRLRRFTDHEAFLPGTVVTLHALVPDGIPFQDFQQLMTTAGEYIGFSLYYWRTGYGKFHVLDVSRVSFAETRNLEDSGDAHVDGESADEDGEVGGKDSGV